MDTPSPDVALDERVLREQIASFFLIFDTIFRSRMVFVLVIGALMYVELPTRGVVIYTAAHFLLSLATLLMPRWTSETPISENKRWLRSITGCTVLAGIADGIAPWIFVQPDHLPLTAVLMVVMMANCARAVQSLRPFKLAVVGYVSCAMLPLIAALILQGGMYYYFLAAFAAVHLGMLLRAGMHETDQLSEALILRFEKESLAARLREQVRETELASLEKTRFLAAASHDLRQPLHAIALFGATLENQLLGRDEGINAIRLMQAVNALSQSLETMLDVSRIDAGAVRPAIRSTSLDAILVPLNDVFDPLAEKRSLQLRMRASGVHVRTDAQLLSRILSNLIDNALKYTVSGGVIVASRVRGDTVWIDVRDTGVGIAPDQQECIFDEFYQVGNLNRDRSFGLGIGLSIVKRLCNLLEHPITVRSKPAHGTLFRISVPLDEAPAELRHEIAPHHALADRPYAEAMPRRVLLLDDEAHIRHGMVALFASWGVALRAVGSEQEAVIEMEQASADGRHFDMLLCDFRLPGDSNGAEVGLRLRARFDADLPLVLISGETSPDRLAHVRQLGLVLVTKPVDANALRKVISKACTRAHAAEPA